MNTGEALKILTNGGKIKQKSWPEGRFLTLKGGEIVDETGNSTSIGGYPPTSWLEDVPMREFYKIAFRSSKGHQWSIAHKLYGSIDHFHKVCKGSSYKYAQILGGPYFLPEIQK